jgi:DNA-binding response OmpR family regulator
MWAILLVEDDDRFRKMLAIFLRREGYSVEDVGSGTAALPLIGHSAFDLLITDYQLRDKIDGFDLLARFNQVWPRKGKIVMSGRPEFKNRCDSAGALYLFKPFELDELRQKINSLLPKRKPSLADLTTLSELINRVRLQRVACQFAKEQASRQRTLCTAARNSNSQTQTGARKLKSRMDKLQITRSFL